MNRILTILSALTLGAMAFSDAARADTMAQWTMTGNAGTEASEPTVTLGSGITNGTITRGGGLSGNAGAGSFNSAGWSAQTGGKSNGYLTFTLALGSTAWQLDSFAGSSQSSGTGPGLMGLYYDSGGGVFVQLGTWSPAASPGSTFNLTLTSAPTLTGTVEFRIYAAGSTSQAGGTIGSTGTWRLGSSAGATITLSGHTVSTGPNDSVLSNPSPSSVAFGRVMQGAAPSQNVSLTKAGSSATTYTATPSDNGLTVTADGNAAAGAGTEPISVALANNTNGSASTGSKSYTVTVDNTATTGGTGTGVNDANETINVSATVLANRDITVSGTGASAGSAVNLGKVFVGASTGTTSVTLNGGAQDDNNGTRVNISGSATGGGVTAVYAAGGDNTFDSANESKTVGVSGNFSQSGSHLTGSLNAAGLLANGESGGVGATVDTSVTINYTADVYQRADLSPSNNGTTLDNGGTVAVDNAFSDDGGQRASAQVSSKTVTSGWGVAGLDTGTVIDEGSEQVGTVSFDATGKLNGTHVGSLVLGFQYADSSIQGAGAAPELGNRTWTFSHTVTGNVSNSGSAGVDAGGSLAGFGLVSANAAGTQATLLAGTSSASTTVTMDFSTIAAGAANDDKRVSDVVSLHGTNTDVVVFQLSYNEGDLGSLSEDDLRLGWLSGGQWVLAIDGNTPDSAANFVLGAWNSSYGLGTYGLDTATNTVWAVIDHNSDFAVIAVPEPGTWALLAGAGMIFVIFRRRSAVAQR